MVDIIMPAYNGHETICQAVASVAMQDNLQEIQLTIVDDLSDKPYDYILSLFPTVNIRIIRKPTNTGCGPSRQYGLDRCTEKYFMFLDTDDCLFGPSVVKNMVAIMEREQLDSLWTNYVEEFLDGSRALYRNRGTHMHGKMYRTEYIQKNNIRYNMTRLHEDHAFNAIALLVGGRNRFVDMETYVWRSNPKSLTHMKETQQDIDYSMDAFLTNANYTLTELSKHLVPPDKIAEMAKKYIMSFFRYYNVMMNSRVNQEYLGIYIEDIKKLLSALSKEVTKLLSYEKFVVDFYKDDAIRAMIEQNTLINITFDDFLDLIFDVEIQYETKS